MQGATAIIQISATKLAQKSYSLKYSLLRLFFIGELGLKPRASSTALYYNVVYTAGHTEIHA